MNVLEAVPRADIPSSLAVTQQSDRITDNMRITFLKIVGNLSRNSLPLGENRWCPLITIQVINLAAVVLVKINKLNQC